MPDSESFVSLHFTCRRCGNIGVILAAALNLTWVVLDGFCIQCAGGQRTCYDLLSVDRILRREDEKLHTSAEELRSLEDHPKDEGWNYPPKRSKMSLPPGDMESI